MSDSRPLPKRKAPRTAFKPGQSGNPGGRTRGLAKYIRDQTRDGFELVDGMLALARGEMVVKRWVSCNGEPVQVDAEPDHKDRREALKFLIERGCGRELESVPDELMSTGPNLSKVTPAELLAVFEKIRSLPADAPAIADDDDESDT